MSAIVLLSLLWLLVALTVTLVRAPEVFKSLWMLIQISIGILAFHLVRPIHGEQKRQLVLIGTLVLTAICGVSLVSYIAVSLVGVSPLSVAGVSPDTRLVGFSFEPNIFASQAVGWLAVLFYWRKELPRWAGLAAFLIVISVLLAGTRAAWIAIVVLGIVWIMGGYSGRPARTVLGVMALGAAGLLLLLYTPDPLAVYSQDPLWNRLINIMDTESGTGAYRLQIYDIALQDIEGSGRWFFGSGINTFSQFNLVDPTNVGAAYLSSIWWALLYDVGLVGLLLFVLILLVSVSSAVARFSALMVFVVILICASTTNLIWFVYPWIYWSLIDYRGSAATTPLASAARLGSPLIQTRTSKFSWNKGYGYDRL